MRDKKTGLMSPAQHECYQDNNWLCRLRGLPDSDFQCVFNLKKQSWCEYAVQKKVSE